MPFDAELVMHDGTTITANITPILTSRASGSACIDLKETGAKGLAAVLIMGADIAGATDTLQITIEECATLGGTFVEMATFPLLTKGTGMPGTYILRFIATERYVRALIVVNDVGGGGFSVASCYILLSQYPFQYL